jgi:putative transposase
MANRYYNFAEGEFYHLYNRGNSKQIIFKNESDYDRFKKLLYIANNTEPFVLRSLDDVDIYEIERKELLVHIGAYCLMSNHYHILLSPARPLGISQFMRKLATGYSLYFNKKYFRTGGLFEGPYKAKWADSDRYLKYLFSYIHLNPYRGKHEHENVHDENHVDINNLHEYRHSSLPDYLGEERQVNSILSPGVFPEYFRTVKEHTEELMEWLDYEEI